MVQLVKIRYIGGKNPGFEHVMKVELARALEKRGQIEIVPEKAIKNSKPKKESKTEEPEGKPEAGE